MIFLENKYTQWYGNIITCAKIRVSPEIHETHHIIPKSMGGSNDKDNLVDLTLREHFLVHRLLVKMTSGQHNIKMSWALHRMLFSQKYVVNSRTYEQSRQQFIEMLKRNPLYKSPEWRQQLSKNIFKSWQDADARRLEHSTSMKEKWKRGILKPRVGQDNGMWGKPAWSRGKKFPGTGKAGALNPQAKIYEVCSPSGVIEQTDCLKSYCELHNLDYACMKKVSQGKNKQHRGYTIVSKKGKENQ